MTSCSGFQRSWALRGIPASAGEARRLLRQALADPIYAETLDDAQLAVTEIVTNVVLHADSDLILTLRAEPGRLCVQIRDNSPLLPVERNFGPDATTGRGIGLVRQVTSAYGVHTLIGGHKIVWFVIGPVELAGSPWPFLDDTDDDPGHDPTVAQPQALPPNAVHITLDGVPPALWLAMLADGDASLREIAHFQAEHPHDGITRAELAQANLARGQGMLAIERAIRENLQAAHGSTTVRFWVTLEQSRHFTALSQLASKSDQLTANNRLLHTSSAPAHVALRRWAFAQIRSQVDGQPARAWNEADALTEAQSTHLATKPKMPCKPRSSG